MIIGAGKLGGPVLDLLAARYPDHRYVLVCRRSGQAERRVNLTRYMCAQWGMYPDLRWDTTDILDIDRTSAVIARHEPDIVLNATTPFPWWLIDEMPEFMRALAYGAGPGMWCALDCLLPTKLSEGLEAARSSAVFVNACYPDAVNAFLGHAACGPSLGIGNLSNLVPGLRLAFAHALSQHPSDIEIRLVCHHYTSLNGPSTGGGDAPYQLTVCHPGHRQRFEGPDNTPFTLLASTSPRIRGLDGQGVTVSSAATVLASLLKGEQRRHHAPGPLGLPGGYPIVLSESGIVSLDLPDDTTVSEAVAINVRAQYSDGVREVGPDAITATDAARDAFREIVGTELPTVTRENMFPVAQETVARLNTKYDLGLTLR